MIDPRHKLPVVQQARLLDLSRSSVYYLPKPTPDADLRLMRRMDELHLEYPFAGARMLRDMLLLEGHKVLPGKLTTMGFHFNYPTINGALINLLG